MKAIHAHYEGKVQGVGFRASILSLAKGYEVTGWVRNLADGRVHLLASGEDEEVEEEAHVLHVVEIVLQLPARVLHGRPVGVIDLRPSGNAGLHHVALLVVGNRAGQFRDDLGPLGARADERHITHQDVEELRNLIDAIFADEAARGGDAGIIFR